MRRMVKEKLVKFDGKPLFPERRAYTVNYDLSDPEAKLYAAVTDYVRDEMNRADRLAEQGEGRRGNRVGFALTTLQRRLASSPEAIYQSLRRRRERLQHRLREERIQKRGRQLLFEDQNGLPVLDSDDIAELDDAPEDEVTQIEDHITEQASAAQTIAELEAEIETLERLENLAFQVRQSRSDKKWEELSNLLQHTKQMFDAQGHRRKLIVFTEHRDTLNYLRDNIQTLVGRPESVVTIHGGIGRDERRRVQEDFIHNKEVQVLVATDAAGEGVNLQRAHLMVNYDLPWNPNRLEQRFGRIHRIGQTEVCHMWNLVAGNTREGAVFDRLLEKLNTEREALGGGVFDVLGNVFQSQEKNLRELLIEAIRYGDTPSKKAELDQIVDTALDREHLRELLERRALATESMDSSKVQKIREDMERAEARKLQPHFIRSFFIEAFRLLGGTIRERETKRFEITNVPAVIRTRDRQIGRGEPILRSYERICFEKELISVTGKPLAEFICPGHPLLDSIIDLILERYRNLLKSGAVLLDEEDESENVRALFSLEHSLQDARKNRDGSRRIVSKQMQFVEVDEKGSVRTAGYAPYLDYRPLTEEEIDLIRPHLEAGWLRTDLEPRIVEHAATEMVPRHLGEVKGRKEQVVTKTMAAVKERLTKEINYWDHRAEELKEQELAGKPNARLNSGKARQRADDLESRLRQRTEELEQERHITPLPPVVMGGALVVPLGVLLRAKGERNEAQAATISQNKDVVEKAAMEAVMEAERSLGFEPVDRSADKCGYDIESKEPETGHLRFIEAKGRSDGGER